MQYVNATSSEEGHINLIDGVLRNTSEISGLSDLTVNFTGELKLFVSADNKTWSGGNLLTSGVSALSVNLDTFNYFCIRGTADISSISISYTCQDETFKDNSKLVINHLDSNGHPLLASTFSDGDVHQEYSIQTPVIDGLLANHPSIKGVYQEQQVVRDIYFNEFDTYTTDTVASTDFVEEDGYYYIDSAADLIAFGKAISSSSNKLEAFKGKTVKLRKSINWANNTFNHIGSANYGKSVAGTVEKFAGTFDGGNNIIANMTYNNSSTLYYGFFTSLANATVKNLTLTQTATFRDRTGGLGYTAFGNVTIDNVHVYSDLTAITNSGFVGGFIGGTQPGSNISISNSGYYGKFVTAATQNYIGGLIGHAQSNTTVNINNCVSYFDKDTNVGIQFGGVVGYIGPTTGSGNITVNINDTYTSGTIVSSAAANDLGNGLGGAVGHLVGNTGINSYVNVSNFKNYADLSGNINNIGGILGAIYQKDAREKFCHIAFENSVNYGNINGLTLLGGILGKGHFVNDDSHITNCANYGNVTGTGKAVAGICGYGVKADIIGSTNYGTITGVNDVAGILGTGSTSYVKNCVNHGDVNGTTGATAGLVATHNENAQLIGGGNTGNITATKGNAGGLVSYNGINSIIDFDNMIVAGSAKSTSGKADLTAASSNNVIVHKYVNGMLKDYDFVIPGNAYTPTSHRLANLGTISAWYLDATCSMVYEETILGETGVNSNNLRLSIYTTIDIEPTIGALTGKYYENLEIEFPEVVDFATINPQYQSIDPNLYNFQMWTTREGIQIYVEQNTKHFKNSDTNQWKNTHTELHIWNNDFGYGWGGTYLALFTNNTYYLNNKTNLKGVYYTCFYETVGDITHIEYYLDLQFDNNTQNDDPSYAYIKPYQFMPGDYNENLLSQNIWRDDRYLITGYEESFGVHQTIDQYMPVEG